MTLFTLHDLDLYREKEEKNGMENEPFVVSCFCDLNKIRIISSYVMINSALMFQVFVCASFVNVNGVGFEFHTIAR